jgi:lipooligosaccharide transport system ATP-binding protein
MLLGLSKPDSGSISVFGLEQPVFSRQIRAQLGVVGQFDTLDPDFNCQENLLAYGRYFGIPAKTIIDRTPSLLEFAALGHKATARIDALSGGMKRRLSLARALVNAPRLLVLDEPTTGLDPQARHLMWERLNRLRKGGTSILLTTHFMDEAERLCDQILVIDHGRKIAQGSPRTLISEHVEPHVVEVFGPGLLDALPRLSEHSDRSEQSGETVFFYGQEPHRLLQVLEAMPELRVLHRPANLEDVFLKLTGRQIREAA